MGMTLTVRTVSDASLRALLEDPESILGLLGDVDVEDDGDLTDEGLECNVDKAWHGIHFLLTGSAEAGKGPEAYLLVGGREIGDVDVGYGPARGFTAIETREAAEALAKVSPEELARRYDPAKLEAAEIYPTIWVRDGEEALEYLIEYYGVLREFLSTAEAKGMGTLVYLC